MAWFTDSLRGAIEAASRFNPLQRGSIGSDLPGAFSHQMAVAAYMSSGMLKKVIAIPADDRVREWRDWQAEQDVITKIEDEERRLALLTKVQQAETLRGVGGGAIIVITAGDHASELTPDQVSSGGIVALNVVSRWQIHAREIGTDLASSEYGLPTYFEVNGASSGQTRIHPSRVICFRGAPLPAGSAIDPVEAFWGDSRLLRVFSEVSRSDETQAWFAALVRKAKLLRIGIPDLDSRDQDQLAKRVALIAQGENSLNATLYRSGGGNDDPGEKIDDYQVTWAGIPAVMDAFDQRIAAVSDIPFTRLMGRSPAGMNSTGKADDDNWNKMVVTGQRLETRPCLEQLDPFLLKSAGVDPAIVTWKFAPLSVPSEKEDADTFKITMEAIEKLQATGAIPDEAFAKGVQNLMAEREYIPGLDQALAEIPVAERFGLSPEDDGTDPSALQAGKEGDPASAGGGTRSKAGAPRHVNDGGSQTCGRPFDDGKRSRRRGLKGKAHGSWNEVDHPRGRGGKFIRKGGAQTIGSTRTFTSSVKRGRDDTRVHRIGLAANAATIHRDTGHDVHGFSRSIPANAVRHAIKSHGNDARPVRARDIARVAHRLDDAHQVTAKGKLSDGSGIRIEHRVKLGNRTAIYIERMGRRDRQLRMVTMRWEK